MQQFRTIIERDQGGIYIASVPSLPGCHTQAKTYEEVVKRIREAVELYVEVLKDKKQLKTFSTYRMPSFLAVEDLVVKI